MPKRFETPSVQISEEEKQAKLGVLDRIDALTDQALAIINQAKLARADGQDEEVEKLKAEARKLLAEAEEIKRRYLSQETGEDVPLAQAREFLGASNVIGPEDIKAALGIEIQESEIPPISYTREQLEKAKENKERLILRISHDSEEQPLTMERINEIMQARMDIFGQSELLYNTDWYKNEEFYTNAPLKTEWKLVGTEFIPNSTSQNYAQQTKALREYLKTTDSLTTEEEQSASDAKLKQLCGEMGVDFESGEIIDQEKYNQNWAKTAKKLANLAINQNHRQSAPEMLYDWLMQYAKTKDRGRLEANYGWSNSAASSGSLVGVGDADTDGVEVYGWKPLDRGGGLGVLSLR